MRDRTILLESFDEIKILQQFLYMDADNSVSMKNKLGVIVQIRLTDDLQYLGKNLQFPNVPEMNFDGEMNLKVFRELIQQLKFSRLFLILLDSNHAGKRFARSL